MNKSDKREKSIFFIVLLLFFAYSDKFSASLYFIFIDRKVKNIISLTQGVLIISLETTEYKVLRRIKWRGMIFGMR